MRLLTTTLMLMFTVMCSPAFAGFQGYNGTTSLGIFNKMKCNTGLTCTKVGDTFSVVSSPTISTGALTLTGPNDGDDATLTMAADRADDNGDTWKLMSKASDNKFYLYNNTSGSQVAKWSVDTSGNVANLGTLTVTGATTQTGGVASAAAAKTVWSTWAPGVATQATSATPAATSVYLTQIWVPHNVTLTGIAVLNAATVGTNKWVFALFDDAGVALANTALAGVTTSGASVFQKIAFTGTYAAKGPRTYWIGAYMNGVTDRYYSVPAIGAMGGLAGSVAGQTFGTVANVTLPTTFTADTGPIAYVY